MELSTTRNVSANGRKLHVVMFPWLAHGHICPYAQLSKRLAEHGIDISFVSTPLNISKLNPFFADQNSPGEVRLLELALPCVDGLPPGIENTTDLPPDLWLLLLKAMIQLEKPFERLLHQLSPDCVVYDLAQSWTPTVAAKLGIPSVFFLTFGAAYFSYEYSPARAQNEEITAQDLTTPPPDYPSSVISSRLFEARSRLGIVGHKIQGTRGIDRILRCYEGCSAIAIKSCYEIEGKFIRYFEKVTGKPVLPLGPLLPEQPVIFNHGYPGQYSRCFTWLDKQPHSSVVYVSFGSEYFLSEDQIRELVLGLEASGVPFICVLRFPACSDQQRRASASLPDGFERRIMNRGLVVGGWAPQMEILCHPSTGGFLTHCGWSSLTEGMSLGLPIIALPMQLDQGLNARLVVEELKVGIEVARDLGDGSFTRQNISKAVRLAMVGEQSKQLRLKAAEMGDVFQSRILSDAGNNGSGQAFYINQFIQHLYGLKTS